MKNDDEEVLVLSEIKLGPEAEKEMLRATKEFFLNERDEELSDFQAAVLLDFMVRQIGPYFYNQAVAEAQALMTKKVEELYGLEKRIDNKSGKK